MIKKRSPRIALAHFTTITVEKLRHKIHKSLTQLAEIKPKNHREQLSFDAYQHRVQVLQIILKYREQPDLQSRVEAIATLCE